MQWDHKNTGSAGANSYNTTGGNAGDYFTTFNGTSAACPHAAAVAALVLSVNANLTADNVKTIIENTADKIPGYLFSLTPGYNNGTWNDELVMEEWMLAMQYLQRKADRFVMQKYCNSFLILFNKRTCNDRKDLQVFYLA